jgi:Raf kinase inhibitor-like YbhB/YbcL family protein
MQKNSFILLTVLILFLYACDDKGQTENKQKEDLDMKIKITSSAFKDGDMIPLKYTCDGKNVSPPLQWDLVPDGTKSIALICDDPDAPSGDWTHWVVYNLPADVRLLSENIPNDETLPDGTRQGLTDFGTTGYSGPCPPWGVHRYYFKIYALDKKWTATSLLRDN